MAAVAYESRVRLGGLGCWDTIDAQDVYNMIIGGLVRS